MKVKTRDEVQGKSRQKIAAENMSPAQKIHRALRSGPPASELKTPLGAVTAAQILHKELEVRMRAEGLKPQPGDWGVCIAYISPDLSVSGFTSLLAPGREAALMEQLNGNIMLGLIFGMRDRDAKSDDDKIVMGARPFFVLRAQTDDWLSQLIPAVRLEIEDS